MDKRKYVWAYALAGTVYREPQRCKIHFYCHYTLKLAGIMHGGVLAGSDEKYHEVDAVQLWAIARSSSGAGIPPSPVQSLVLTPWFPVTEWIGVCRGWKWGG